VMVALAGTIHDRQTAARPSTTATRTIDKGSSLRPRSQNLSVADLSGRNEPKVNAAETGNTKHFRDAKPTEASGRLGTREPRQLGDVRRDPPGLVAGEELGRRAPSRLLLEDGVIGRRACG
jgi:hypothetical protein